jgi:hypothetical protein
VAATSSNGGLTAAAAKNALPRDKDYKLADSGGL